MLLRGLFIWLLTYIITLLPMLKWTYSLIDLFFNVFMKFERSIKNIKHYIKRHILNLFIIFF